MVRRTTITDIARQAGVSIKTVSRVLNDEPHVRADVRARVKQVAEELHYHPNLNARGLITRQSFLIGLTYERPSASYVVELQRGALDRLEHERYRLLVLPFDKASQRSKDLFALIRSSSLDGILLAPPSCDDLGLLDALDNAGIAYARIAPTVALERGIVAIMDDTAAARSIAGHLLQLGHTKLAIITGRQTHAATRMRLDGYRQAIESHGLDFGSVLVESGDFGFESGEGAARRILDRQDPPTAIIAENDDMAVGAITVAREMGFSIPSDLSVVGFDDSEIARLSWPRLTTIKQPVFAMSRQAMDDLLKHISKSDEATSGSTMHRHELLLRDSTSQPSS